jgi:NAD(P)-dependent dehydrogenase (short-subunit alcohol dehydrogenase family)
MVIKKEPVMNWKGKVAIVTGGASGIGAATVREFAGEGAAVAIFDISQAGQVLAEQLQKDNLPVIFQPVDVANQELCRENVKSVVERFGRLDYLVNSAVTFLGKGLDVTTADWEVSLGVNVRGYANMAQACYECMPDGGAIVNVASISGHIAQPKRWTYNASKGAILSLTRCMALDMAPAGIRVNSVTPSWVWTPEVEKAAGTGEQRKVKEQIWSSYHMLRRLGQPREVARAILFLCSEDASFITGAELPVDGGYMALGAEGLGEHSTSA